MEYVLEIQDLTKKFDNNYALKNVDFSLKRGEIHGIVGANGSGKSTFMSILFGNKHIQETGGYKGRILLDGKEVKHKTPLEALGNGIGMIHQEFALFGDLSVGNNIKINRESAYPTIEKLVGKNFALVDKKRDLADAERALSKAGVSIDPQIKVNNITVNMKQFVEIAREIDRPDLKILMLDEPTASLNQKDTSKLLDSLKALSKKGVSIIFVSHRLDEVTQICDTVTVLRDGERISTYSHDAFDIDRLSTDMIGQEVVQAKKTSSSLNKPPIISFKNITVAHGEKIYRDLSLDINEGEILGITGLAGYGQEVFSYGLMGLYPMRGDVFVDGKKINTNDPTAVRESGIYMLPEERKEMGILSNKPIWENLTFGTHHQNEEFLRHPKLRGLSFLNHRNIEKHCNQMVEELNIKISDIHQPIRELSGGNQQKVCIGRALTMKPRVLFVGEPTRGIDIYSKEIILDMILKMNEEKNMTVVVSSGEVGELRRICDRIVVMYQGEIFDIFDKSIDSKTLSLAILGRRNGSSKEN